MVHILLNIIIIKGKSLHTLNTFDSTSTTLMRRMWEIVGVVWCSFFDSSDRRFKYKLASKKWCKRNCDVFTYKVLNFYVNGWEVWMVNLVDYQHCAHWLILLMFWVLMWYNPLKLNCNVFNQYWSYMWVRFETKFWY